MQFSYVFIRVLKHQERKGSCHNKDDSLSELCSPSERGCADKDTQRLTNKEKGPHHM